MRRQILVVSLLVLLAACGGDSATNAPITEDAVIGTWIMTRANGEDLPYALETSPFRVEVTGGFLSLAGNHDGGLTVCVRNMYFKPPDLQNWYNEITWLPAGTHIVLRYRNPHTDTLVVRNKEIELATWSDADPDARYIATFKRVSTTPFDLPNDCSTTLESN